MALANLAIAHFGPWFLPVTAFVAVGVVLVTRDYLHDVWASRGGSFWPRMLVMIAAAGVLACAGEQAAGMIAVSSVVGRTGSHRVDPPVFTAAGRLAYAVDQSAGMIAIASVAALTGSSIVETLVFQGVFRRRWMVRSNASNVAGAVADSLIFPVVAFGVTGVGGWAALLALVATQAATKTLGGLLWATVFRFTLNPDARRARRARLTA